MIGGRVDLVRARSNVASLTVLASTGSTIRNVVTAGQILKAGDRVPRWRAQRAARVSACSTPTAQRAAMARAAGPAADSAGARPRRIGVIECEDAEKWKDMTVEVRLLSER